MLEIILIVVLASKLRGIAQAKGRSGGWAALGPVLWILGEIIGAVVGGIVGMDGIGLYVGALIGAAIGAGVAFMIVNGLSPNEMMAEPMSFGHQPIPGGNYDPSNPYNAPGGAPPAGGNPYSQPPPQQQPPGNPNSPFNQ